MRLVVTLALTVVLGGCSLFGGRHETIEGPRLGDVARDLPRWQADVPAAKPKPERREVLARYRDLAERVEDPELALDVMRRRAELEALVATDRVANGETIDTAPLVQTLETTLAAAASAGQTEPAGLRYRLAQVRDLGGDTDGVLASLGRIITAGDDEARVLEARFRRAEILFSRGDYDGAAADFEVATVQPSSLQLHAGYMLGWAQFKAGRHAAALSPLLQTMDALLSADSALGQSQQELLADTQRVAVLTLDYLDGPATLAAAMSERANPPWQPTLYEALGTWYRDKGRFTDSARTWQAFLDNNPLDLAAPSIVLQVIRTNRDAGFVAEIPAWERRFVESFDRRSEFQAVHGEVVMAPHQDVLLGFMDRLVDRHHAEAQSSGDARDYLLAADWYGRWLHNFPANVRAAERHFLMAEALADAGELESSIAVFDVVAEGYPTTEYGRDAAWAVVSGLRSLVSDAAPLTARRTAAAVRFADRYPDDARAGGALVDVAAALFDAADYEQAVAISARALTFELGENRVPAQRIEAHGLYELGEYREAANRYRRLVDELPDDGGLRERLMASVFAHGGELEAAGEVAAAIDVYESMIEIDATSDVAIDALFDVAALKEDLGQHDAAALHLESFRKRFPAHEGVASIPTRLVTLYETTGQADLAARELLAIHAGGAGTEVGRLALYRAGELMLDIDDVDGAIETFRSYAHGYESPLALRLEAMDHMDRLYQRAGEPQKRNYWLRKKADTVEAAPNDLLEPRSRFLGADAALQLATQAQARFETLSLKQPLEKSLAAKQKAMKTALAAFQRAAAFEVSAIKGQATHAMAAMYLDLADSLIDSERPDGLNALELSQYELLIEEQAFPFEEKAIELLETNLRRGWQSGFDPAIAASLGALQQLVPGRFDRPLMEVAYAPTLY